MTLLPKWYLECAEDYLSMLRYPDEYTHAEMLEATKNQRLAEYKLMAERLTPRLQDPEGPPRSVAENQPTPVLPLYGTQALYQGHLAQRRKLATRPTSTNLWERVLKPPAGIGQ